MPDKVYEIGGRKFIQAALVWGQIRLLRAALEGTELPAEMTPETVFEAVDSKLPQCLAAVLVEEGKAPGEANPGETADWFDRHVTLDTALEVIEDFFTCNPIPSVLNRFARVIGHVAGLLRAAPRTKSRESSPSSPEETSPVETPSSGDAPPPTPTPTSSTGGGKPSSGSA